MSLFSKDSTMVSVNISSAISRGIVSSKIILLKKRDNIFVATLLLTPYSSESVSGRLKSNKFFGENVTIPEGVGGNTDKNKSSTKTGNKWNQS